ncbi:MAG: Stealth CR1 domain-containing protein [Leuconostoc mesenteroides]
MTNKNYNSFPIDAVVLWVDDTDKDWVEKKEDTVVIIY